MGRFALSVSAKYVFAPLYVGEVKRGEEMALGWDKVREKTEGENGRGFHQKAGNSQGRHIVLYERRT